MVRKEAYSVLGKKGHRGRPIFANSANTPRMWCRHCGLPNNGEELDDAVVVWAIPRLSANDREDEGYVGQDLG